MHITLSLPLISHLQAYFIIPVTIFAMLSSVFLIALPIFQKPVPTLLALGAILLGIPIYILFVMEVPWKLRPPVLDRISRKLSEMISLDSIAVYIRSCMYTLCMQYSVMQDILITGIILEIWPCNNVIDQYGHVAYFAYLL